ncbi:hypothetical protein JKP88DRAFT_204144 [Tribonema minus]|uniref:Uncharacterized protein n=1 Tax=Tribonema minus TaxID=303371 RepID=A0A835ZHZ6_9STRA|nr:hypothetical protein JKP88DRAFT_204144 [Tribonema minus]
MTDSIGLNGNVGSSKAARSTEQNVHAEPMHVKQFSNSWVYSYRVKLVPGRPCEMHKHTEDTFYRALTDGPCKAKTAEGKEFDQDIKKGSQWWNLNKTEGPMVHQVTLAESFPHRSDFFALEFLKSPPIDGGEPLKHPAYTLDTKYSREGTARVYHLEIGPGESTGIHRWQFFAVVLSVSDGKLTTEGENSPFLDKALQRYGGDMWVEGPVEFSVTNIGDQPYQALVIELLKHD